MGVDSWGQGGPCPPPPNFHTWFRSTVVYRGLIVLFFDLFSVAPPSSGRGLIVLFFGLFFRWPLLLEIFLPTPLKCALTVTQPELQNCSVTNFLKCAFILREIKSKSTASHRPTHITILRVTILLSINWSYASTTF